LAKGHASFWNHRGIEIPRVEILLRMDGIVRIYLCYPVHPEKFVKGSLCLWGSKEEGVSA
jgi:hypothetical protein